MIYLCYKKFQTVKFVMTEKSSNKDAGRYFPTKNTAKPKKLNSSIRPYQSNTVPKKSMTERLEKQAEDDEIDSKFGFQRYKVGPSRTGWLLNYLPITVPDETGAEKAALDLYFIDREGNNFKASIFYETYFYVDLTTDTKNDRIIEISQHLLKRIEGCKVDIVDKEDLDMRNHLSGKKHQFIKLSFGTVSDMIDAKAFLRPIITTNQNREKSKDFLTDIESSLDLADPLSFLIDMREHDLSYSMRASIDCNLRVGSWYIITPNILSATCEVVRQENMLELCEPRILAFDIECEKSPLKFPNVERDRIFMISYMTAGQGYLLINR